MLRLESEVSFWVAFRTGVSIETAAFRNRRHLPLPTRVGTFRLDAPAHPPGQPGGHFFSVLPRLSSHSLNR